MFWIPFDVIWGCFLEMQLTKLKGEMPQAWKHVLMYWHSLGRSLTMCLELSECIYEGAYENKQKLY